MAVIPNVSVYGRMQNEALRAYQEAKHALKLRQGQIWQDYGFTGDYDENTGQANNVRVDPNSQFGRYQQMLRSNFKRFQSAEDDATSRGLGTTGLGGQGVTDARWEAELSGLDFGKAFLNESNLVNQGYRESTGAYNRAMLDAEHQALLAALAERQFQEAGDDTPSGPDRNTQSTAVQPGQYPPRILGTQPGETGVHAQSGTRGGTHLVDYDFVDPAGGSTAYWAEPPARRGKKANEVVRNSDGRWIWRGNAWVRLGD